MAYNSKYTGAEVDALLDKVAENDVISIDSALSTTSENPVMNKVIAEELEYQNIFIEDLQNTKIDKEADDYYPQLSVGLADNLAGVDVVDSEISFRRSGGGAISDGAARIEAIKGNSVVWNQIVNAALIGGLNYGNPQIETTDSGIIYTFTEEGNFAYGDGSRLTFGLGNNIVANHKYAVLIDVKTPSTGIQLFVGEAVWDRLPVTPNTLSRIGRIQTITEVNNNYKTQGAIYPIASGASVVSGDVLEVYNPIVYDLTKMFGAGNEPTTIEEFNARKPLGIDENAYNEGEVISMNVNGIKSVGVKEGEESTEDLSIVGKYFPNGMNGVGSAYDDIRYNKSTNKWEKVVRFGEVELGTLSYSKSGIGTHAFYTLSLHGKVKNAGKLLTSQFCQVGGITSSRDAEMSVDSTGTIYFSLFAHTDAASFKAAMQGVVLYYELAEPIVTEIEEQDFNTDYLVWNGGSEEIVSDVPTSPLKADIAYGFNAIGKIKELEEKISQMTAQILQMQASLTQSISSTNEI